MKNIKSVIAPIRRSVRVWLLERYWEAFPSKCPAPRATSCLKSDASGAGNCRDKDTRKVLKSAEKDWGCEVEVRNNNHLRVTEKGGRFITVSSTPSDTNAYKQVKRDLHRIGVMV